MIYTATYIPSLHLEHNLFLFKKWPKINLEITAQAVANQHTGNYIVEPIIQYWGFPNIVGAINCIL